jgi:hypothetical protein
MAEDAGVVVEICVHRPKRQPPPFPSLFEEFLSAGAPVSLRYLVAGQVVGGLVEPALKAGFAVVIVGGVVSDAGDPSRIWASLVDEAAMGEA